MKAPKLTRRLILEAPVQAADGAGGFSENWVALGVQWAEVRAGTGREAGMAGLSVSSVPYRITVRAAPQGAQSRPMAGQRFVDALRKFRVIAVTEADPGAKFLICTAREEVAT